MCWATTITLSCVDCDTVINTKHDYEYLARPGVCFDCFTKKRERRKEKQEEEKKLKEMEEEEENEE
ncbi:uncharacterized protein FIESC28_06202 [Fusarium coffeatum]|uniref:LIM zinc-binding domain-containing protein n=1 Tax=Fusarium coffeatum TaxID=231269 RepID=A0A366RNU3_9HYPO|nr:uncharacterized protein FIESC28_06202 [Fusarium coffeatum]RBR18136.1 hypothetical protein FIESC28_06202 [Fusarium coffeatum]